MAIFCDWRSGFFNEPRRREGREGREEKGIEEKELRICAKIAL
ncbi:hypothetical protein QT971_19430 [Microcoleus sp. herbarium19]